MSASVKRQRPAAAARKAAAASDSPLPSPASSSPSSASSSFLRVVPSSIKNKVKRAEVFAKQKHAKRVQQSAERKRRRKETAALGEDERATKRERDAKRQKTLDNTREADDTIVADNDEEVQNDESMDEFSSYFKGDAPPKIVITSGYKPTKARHNNTTLTRHWTGLLGHDAVSLADC